MKKFVGIVVSVCTVLVCGRLVISPMVRTVSLNSRLTVEHTQNIPTNSFEHTLPSDKICGNIAVTAEEFDLFCHIVACEADPKWGYAGALDVATVIVNRLPYWGGTIMKVVSAYDAKTGVYQFSTYPIWGTSTPQSYEIRACWDALNGKRSLPSNALFFCTPESYVKSSFFQRLIVVARRNGHVFMSN